MENKRRATSNPSVIDISFTVRPNGTMAQPALRLGTLPRPRGPSSMASTPDIGTPCFDASSLTLASQRGLVRRSALSIGDGNLLPDCAPHPLPSMANSSPRGSEVIVT
jgi:hypothetical protein